MSFCGANGGAWVKAIKAALNGNDRPENVFAIIQSRKRNDAYQAKMLACDRHLETLSTKQNRDLNHMPDIRSKTTKAAAASFDVKATVSGFLGIDLVQCCGTEPSFSLKAVRECGNGLPA